MKKIKKQFMMTVFSIFVLTSCFSRCEPTSSTPSPDASESSISTETSSETSVTESSNVSSSENLTNVQSVKIKQVPVVTSFVRQKIVFSDFGTLLVSFIDNNSELMDINADMLSEINIFTSKPQIVFVTYGGKYDYFILELQENIAEAKTAARTSLENEFNEYIADDYREVVWLSLITAYEEGIVAINNAKTLQEVNRALSVALSAMRTFPTRAEDPNIMHPFMNNYGDYILRPNDDGSVVEVSWLERPKAWASIATSMSYNLNHNFSAFTQYTITVENTSNHPVAFLIQALSDSESNNSNSGTSGHLLLDALEKRVIEITLTNTITSFHLFIDSSYEDMNDAYESGGNIIISDYGFIQTGEIIGGNAHLYSQYDQNVYTITNKTGVDANITYQNIKPNSYWPRIVREIDANVGEDITIVIRNNGSKDVYIGLHAGLYNDDRSDSSNNHFFPLWKNSGRSGNYFSDGESFTVAAGTSITKVLSVDESSEHGVDKEFDAFDCIQLLVDNGIYNETALRSGNIDIVSIEIK